MIYRNLRQISTGQWLNVLLTVDGPEFSVKASVHRDQIAEGWGLAPTDVGVVDGDTDARTGTLLPGPVPPAPVPDPDLVDIQTALPTWDTLTTAQKLAVVKSGLRLVVKTA